MLDDLEIVRRNNAKHDNRREFVLPGSVVVRGFNRAAARVFTRVAAAL